MSEIINELLEKLKQCDDFHNRCDFLMEHSEITYMLDYITKLKQENKLLNRKYLNAVADYETTMSENKELNKQLKNCYCNRTDCSGRLKDSKQYDSLVQRVENHQKEFINYLTSYIELLSDDSDYVEEGQKDILEEVLLKYKESGE